MQKSRTLKSPEALESPLCMKKKSLQDNIDTGNLIIHIYRTLDKIRRHHRK